MAAPTPPPAPETEPGAETVAEDLPKFPSKTWWWIGGVLMVVGIFGGVVLAGIGIGRAVSLTKTQRVNVPGTRTLALEPGAYQVKIEESSYTYSLVPRVFVKPPDGNEIEITANSDPYNDNNRYATNKKLGYFDAPQAGSYTVRAERRADLPDEDEYPTTTRRGSTTTTRFGSSVGRSGYPGTVSVARTDDEAAGASVPLILGGLFGGLGLVLAASIILIVTGVKAGKARKARRPKPAFLSFPPPAFAGPAGYGAPGGHRPPPPGPAARGPYGAPPPPPFGAYPPPGPAGFGPPPGPGGFGAPPPGPAGYGPPPPGPASFAGPPPRGPAYPGPPPPGYGPSGSGPAGDEPYDDPAYDDPAYDDPAYDDLSFDEPPEDRPHYGDPPFPDPTR